MGVIVRTAGVDRDVADLQWDLDYLRQLSDAIDKAAAEERSPALPVPGEQRRRARHPRLPALGHRRGADRFQGGIRSGAGVHRPGDAAVQGAHQALRRAGAAVQPLPDRKPDRDRLRARSEAAIRRQRRHRPDRSAGLHRHQLRPRHQGRGHRGDRPQHQPGSRRGSGAATAAARCRRADRHRLHRHGVGAQPARRRGQSPARRSRPTAPGCRPRRSPASA